ncbi:TonB-dependent receptor [Flagellatimonas centrodinii]|uniref:TonB-dependent receptor domain-containing protein n=1 Tax=Flagellatimonas centrodinii TaxID=2806210 RepID=UPI001FF06488|nr:TonB-dependent receptor [Flagellatimonas centrodinii]ULQ48008.1 TonB-dependent receptor [Flagellatimonas centrodinii]
MMHVTRRRPAYWSVACLSLLMAGALPVAYAETVTATPVVADPASPDTRSFDIPAQSLRSALIEYGQQSGHELLYTPEDVDGLSGNAVNGTLSREAALSELLRGTGLRYDYTPSGGVVIGTPEKLDALGASRAGSVDSDPILDVETARRRGVEEIIVTGQKKEERLQDVPIAISAFSMEDLTRSQIAGGPDLITQVPNMTFTKTNFTGYNIQIRGIGTQAISATTDPAVAVAFNNTTLIRNRFFEQEFYDMSRVEVLRGPQGTLYGRNATAGVVNLITAKPEFYESARLSLDTGNYNSQRWEGMANLPLVEDKAALRFAAAGTKRDGYVTNELTGQQIDGRDLWSTRLSLRVQPTDTFDVNLVWEHFNEDDDRLRSGKQLCKKDLAPDEIGGLPVEGSGGAFGLRSYINQGCAPVSLYSDEAFQTPNGYSLPYYGPTGNIGNPVKEDQDPYLNAFQSRDLRVIESSLQPDYRAESDIVQLQLSWDFDSGLTLDSETAHGTDFLSSFQDYNRFTTAPQAFGPASEADPGVLDENNVFCDPQLGCSDRLLLGGLSTAQSTQFSQEFRLSSDFDGPFNFSLGTNYLRYDTEDKYYVFINSITMLTTVWDGSDQPYVAGQTDNTDCLAIPNATSNPFGLYNVAGCTYVDPNPIGALNDKGRNYFLSKNPYELRSYSIFGETYVDVTDNLKVTAGLRWTVDKKHAPQVPSWFLVANSGGTYPAARIIDQEWRQPTGRFTVDWKPDLSFTDETLIYGSYARGYKAGGTNPPPPVVATYATNFNSEIVAAMQRQEEIFDAEFVNAFEIGTKNTLFDGRLTANLAAFYYDYTDYQVSEIVNRAALNRNFDAKIWGAEIELDWFALENLRLGFKGGYQKTRIADGESAIDLMDRTAGNPDWIVVRPFPTVPSNCIFPLDMVTAGGRFNIQTGFHNVSGSGACVDAYYSGLDPVTGEPYAPGIDYAAELGSAFADYEGFDPATAPNGGRGFSKELGGNELPNAPNYTGTVTADYGIPLSGNWMMNLHTDIHWQSESWWRVFNDHEFARLDDYFTMNLAAIFVNDAAGWNIMAYIKNVTDETAISGAFLNSDDTGLTTNVFLTEPRLFGLRVTKHWNGDGLLGNFGARRGSDYRFPLSLEVGGQLAAVDAPNEAITPSFDDAFTGPLDIFAATQNQDLGWGDNQSVKLTWHMDDSPWAISGRYRRGKHNETSARYAEQRTEPIDCLLTGTFFESQCNSNDPSRSAVFDGIENYTIANYASIAVRDREEYRITDMTLSRELGIGALTRSTVGLSLRRADFQSDTNVLLDGIPDWDVPESGIAFFGIPGAYASRTHYSAEYAVDRNFKGTGLVLSWDAASRLFGNDQDGHVELDWSLSAGLLHGDQTVTGSGSELESRNDQLEGVQLLTNQLDPTQSSNTETEFPEQTRTNSENVPVFGASLGLAYRVGGFSIGAGYSWERYVDAIDGGVLERKSYDRTIEGPTAKVSIDFGG